MAGMSLFGECGWDRVRKESVDRNGKSDSDSEAALFGKEFAEQRASRGGGRGVHRGQCSGADVMRAIQ